MPVGRGRAGGGGAALGALAASARPAASSSDKAIRTVPRRFRSMSERLPVAPAARQPRVPFTAPASRWLQTLARLRARRHNAANVTPPPPLRPPGHPVLDVVRRRVRAPDLDQHDRARSLAAARRV